MAAFFGTLGLFTIPESSHSKILQNRAKRLRLETKNWAFHSKADETPIDFHSIIHTHFFRPFIMLVQEPILLLVTIYMSLIYGILYLFFEAYPISFQEQRGVSEILELLFSHADMSRAVTLLISCLSKR
jgi:DHA1 family multidrug resistance protein-like MFS transporter